MNQVVGFYHGRAMKCEPAFQGFFPGLLAVIGAGVQQRLFGFDHQPRGLQIPPSLGKPLQGALPHFIHFAWPKSGLPAAQGMAGCLRSGIGCSIRAASPRKYPWAWAHPPRSLVPAASEHGELPRILAPAPASPDRSRVGDRLWRASQKPKPRRPACRRGFGERLSRHCKGCSSVFFRNS